MELDAATANEFVATLGQRQVYRDKCVAKIREASELIADVMANQNGKYYGRGDQVLYMAAQQKRFWEQELAGLDALNIQEPESASSE